MTKELAQKAYILAERIDRSKKILENVMNTKDYREIASMTYNFSHEQYMAVFEPLKNALIKAIEMDIEDTSKELESL